MFAKQVCGCVGWVFGFLHGVHAGLFRSHPALKMVAAGAGGDNVAPNRLTAKMAWDDMVDGQITQLSTTVLAGVIVSTKYLFPS